MNTLAMVLRAEGSLTAAESLYKEAIERLTSVGALQSQTASFVFDNFGVLLMQMNRLSEADRKFGSADSSLAHHPLLCM